VSRSGTVLVIDDDPQLRELMQLAILDEGIAVETAKDGREALERIAASPPSLAVLDVTLPLADGFEVAEALRRLGVAIVMVTADGNAAQKAARMGAFRFLRKPFELRDLLASVRAGLDA
jgi:two-component system, OmpR family, response regulator MprA